MTHRVGVVGGSDMTLGFRLAGLEPHLVESREDAARLLDEMVSEAKWGVILVQEELMPESPPATSSSTGIPILVPYPRPTAERPPGEAERYVAELLRKAVGYRVRLR